MIFLLFIFFVTSLHASDIFFLTWQNDPTSTMTIRWLSKKNEAVHQIEYCQVGTSDWQKKQAVSKALPEHAPFDINSVELTALKADSIYRFHILPSKDEHLFQTMPSTDDNAVRFIVGGDLYDKDLDVYELTAKKVAEHNPRFVLLGGDLAYSVSDKHKSHDDFSKWLGFLTSWSKLLKNQAGIHIPVLPAIGNHETKGFFHKTPINAPFFYALFGPSGYKIIRFGTYLSIALLDSGITHPVGGNQTDWLKKELSSQINIRHRFAIYHVPAFPSARSYRGKINTSIRRNWCPLFETYGIHAAFEHHDHCFKRTHPLIKESVDKFGVVYFGDGCWGTTPRIPKNAHRSSYLAKTKSTRQFLQVDLTKTRRTFTAFDPQDAVIDRYAQEVDKPCPIQ